MPAGAADRMWLTGCCQNGRQPFTGGKAQAAFHGPWKPLVDNPESVFRRDGRQSCVVAKNLVDAVLADEREQVFMDIPELDLGRVLLPNNDDAVIGFIVVDGADRVVPKILQQLKAVAGILSQFFAQPAQVVTILGRMTEHIPPYHRERSRLRKKQNRLKELE